MTMALQQALTDLANIAWWTLFWMNSTLILGLFIAAVGTIVSTRR